MSLKSAWKARRSVVMALVILAFIYIGFQLVVDLGWLTTDELVRDLAGIVGVVVLVIVSAFLGAFLLIRWGAKQRADSAARWQALNDQDSSEPSDGVGLVSEQDENKKGVGK